MSWWTFEGHQWMWLGDTGNIKVDNFRGFLESQHKTAHGITERQFKCPYIKHTYIQIFVQLGQTNFMSNRDKKQPLPLLQLDLMHHAIFLHIPPSPSTGTWLADWGSCHRLQHYCDGICAVRPVELRSFAMLRTWGNHFPSLYISSPTLHALQMKMCKLWCGIHPSSTAVSKMALSRTVEFHKVQANLTTTQYMIVVLLLLTSLIFSFFHFGASLD
jgi:hypothetical protein